MKSKSLFLALLAMSPLSLAAQQVEAGLYRPWKAEVDMTYPPAQNKERLHLTPQLLLYGTDLPKEGGTLAWSVQAGKRVLAKGTRPLKFEGGFFEATLPLDQPCPGADRVVWELTQPKGTLKGEAPLTWSRFRGQMSYVDGAWRPSVIYLWPHTFGTGTFTIPIPEDGRFDVEVPARVYGVLNADGAGYAADSLERWGWAFDLRHDREESFRIGRIELYGMNAFTVRGGLSTVFVTFRPTSLTRTLRHTSPAGAPPKAEGTMRLITEHLKVDSMALAPDLRKEQVKVWLDGVLHPVTDLGRVPETNNLGIPQTQYILQITPPRPASRGSWHEVKVEVNSQDVLDGKLIQEFGQGSVGFYID